MFEVDCFRKMELSSGVYETPRELNKERRNCCVVTIGNLKESRFSTCGNVRVYTTLLLLNDITQKRYIVILGSRLLELVLDKTESTNKQTLQV